MLFAFCFVSLFFLSILQLGGHRPGPAEQHVTESGLLTRLQIYAWQPLLVQPQLNKAVFSYKKCFYSTCTTEVEMYFICESLFKNCGKSVRSLNSKNAKHLYQSFLLFLFCFVTQNAACYYREPAKHTNSSCSSGFSVFSV